MIHRIPFLLSLATILGVALGLTVGPVRLVGRTHITYSLNTTGNNSLIECVYHLEDNEQLSRVFWELRDGVDVVGNYVWYPNRSGEATGRLKGVVELDRDDGALYLTQLRYDLSGDYSCGVGLSTGEEQAAASFEVLIVDTNGPTIANSYFRGCTYVSSYQSPTMFPEPKIRAGMYSNSLGGYYLEVPNYQWRKITYSNQSVAYSYKNATFAISSDTPQDVFFKATMGISKTNGDYILLNTILTNATNWIEKGCPDVEPGENKDVYYFPGSSATCRGGRKNTTKATIVCERGYISEGDVSTVSMRCNSDTGEWVMEQGYSARPEDLVCVASNGDDNGDGSPSTTSLCSSLLVVSLLLPLFGPRHP